MTAVTIAPTTIWTEGLNWGISYDLPNDTSIFKEYKKYLPKPMAQRRHRRDLYHKMEVIMDSYVRFPTFLSTYLSLLFFPEWVILAALVYIEHCVKLQDVFVQMVIV